MCNRMLPLGIDSFEELRKNGYYYIDKTEFIVRLLQEQFEVNLITRPRRFGKTLTMSMLEDFFNIRMESRELFEGLKISEYKELCTEWMNQWPVLFISFKDIEGLTFSESYDQLVETISDLCMEHTDLMDSNRVDETDKKRFAELKERNAKKTAVINSLFLLTRMMYRHYGRQVILLIDEYDVPLAKANEHGHYKQMLDCIRGLLSKALKTNRFLKFAVVTGCLRIAKESIFTGTNHFIANSILGDRYTDIFGFTQEDVSRLLADTGLMEYADVIKTWYDGYRIGHFDIYCPWDVLNYVSDLRINPKKRPGNYWKDTSHNDIIRSFIGQDQFAVNDKFEVLLSGGYVKVKLCDDLTYDLLHSSEENFWNILYLTGYLTVMRSEEIKTGSKIQATESAETYLKIPNEEVKTIFAETVVEWFRDNMRVTNRKPLMDALWGGMDHKATVLISDMLFQTISYHNYKEDYYHAFLAGLFTGIGYPTESDKEHGEGRPDVVVKDKQNRRVIIMEAKYSKSRSEMERDCERAVDQIYLRRYAEDFLEGYRTISCYGIAFFKKECLVKKVNIFGKKE